MITTKSLHIDNHKNLKNHIEQMIPKLSGACNALRSISIALTLSNQLTMHTFILL